MGVDADPAHTAMAARLSPTGRLIGVAVVTADARRTGLPPGSFDLVDARTLLVNLTDPSQAVAEMVRLATPGGQVAVAEPDTEHVLCYPLLPAFDRIGRDLRGGLHAVTTPIPRSAAGYRELPPGRADRRRGWNPGRRCTHLGNSRRTVRLDLVRAMRPQILAMGLASQPELDELDATLRPHLEDPCTGRHDRPAVPGLGPQARMNTAGSQGWVRTDPGRAAAPSPAG